MNAPPTFDIVAPCGARRTVVPHDASDTVGDLAAALDAARTPLHVDGHPLPMYHRLIDSPIRAGSVVERQPCPATSGSSTSGSSTSDASGLEVVVVAGPDCGVARPLGPGRHVVGRARHASLRIDDPAVEPHHGLFEVDRTGEVRFLQLAGRLPARVSDAPCQGPTVVSNGVVLTIGSSGVVVRRRAGGESPPAGRLLATANEPWRRVVQRGPAPPTTVPAVDAGRLPTPYADDPLPPATALVGAGVAIVAAGAIALLMGQLMFALFAVFGAVASAATWAVGVVAVLRRRRTGRAAERAEREDFAEQLARAHRAAREAHVEAHPPVEVALTALEALADDRAPTDVWRRRTIDGVALRAVIGRGTQYLAIAQGANDGASADRWPEADIANALDRATTLHDVGVVLELPMAATIAVRGDDHVTGSLARSVIVQLATHYGPADWTLLVVTRTPAAWRWIGWLPHARNAEGRELVVDASDAAALATALADTPAATGTATGTADRRRVVVVVDDVELFATRTGPFRRFVDRVEPCTIALIRAGFPVPARCERVLDTTATGVAVWRSGAALAATADTHPFPALTMADIAIAGISEVTAARAARRLASLIDPEDDHGAAMAIPHSLTLAAVDPITAGVGEDATSRRTAAQALVRRWAAADVDPAPSAAIGRSVDGLVDVDLVRDGPHALIAGTTGSGKSELLRTLVVTLALRLSPEHLTFVLIDYKGGATFDACADLPHTVGLVTDLDDGLAERALVSLEAELRRRERVLRAAGANDLAGLRAKPGAVAMPRLVVVIDEFAALARDLPDFLAAIVGIAQRGRSLGLHLVLATQRPTGVVNDEIRANTNLRLALRLADAADAHDVVGDAAPATFGRGCPGRAALRLGPGELVTFQTAGCTRPVADAHVRLHVVPPRAAIGDATAGGSPDVDPAAPTELAVAVAVIAEAVAATGIARPHRPWLAPLPDRLERTQLAAELPSASLDAIGLVDDPSGQCRRALVWGPGAGNLALVGSLGAGTTVTLCALLAAQCRASDPEQFHCYVINARSAPSLDGFADVAHCGAVVGIGDDERLQRLLTRLVAVIDAPAADRASTRPGVVLAIDGLGSLRTGLASVDDAPTLALLDRVLVDGPAVGVVAWWTDDGTAAAVSAARSTETWVFRLDDPTAAVALGGAVHGGRGTSGVAGRLRIASSGLEAQVVFDDAPAASLPPRSPGRGPEVVARLPSLVAASEVLAHACPTTEPGCELPIGIAHDDLGVATLRVPRHDHVFIGGAATTGKSEALAHLCRAWRAVRPAATVIAVDRTHPLTVAGLQAIADAATCDAVLVAVDDAERIDDVDGAFAAVLAGRFPAVTLAAAARLDAVRAAYGHWTREVARSRCGVILTSIGDVDGDLLGATLPRRQPIAPRPGLGWVVDTRGTRLVQLPSGVRPLG